MLVVRKNTESSGISVEHVSHPGDPGQGDVLVEVAAAGICGSDLHVYEWSDAYSFMASRMPVTLGHEFAGTVTQIGAGVSEVAVGDRVCVMPAVTCMKCDYCLSSQFWLCSERHTLGLTQDGGFARFVLVPARNCIRLDASCDLTLASLVEPLAVGDNAAEVGDVGAGDTVVVLGPGTIGQAVVRAARWRGAECVIAVGKGDKDRLSTALAVGADYVFDLNETPSLKDAISAINQGKLADVVIEATGDSASISDGLAILKRGGILVCVGIHSEPSTFDATGLVRNRQQIRGAHGSTRESWEAIAKRIAAEPETVRPMVSMELPLHEAELGFRQCFDRNASKVVLMP